MKPVTNYPPRNILLIQLGDIGDVVLTTPTIRATKETYPNAQVSILVRKPFSSLLAADPFIHELIEYEKLRGSFPDRLQRYSKFVRNLRRARYDLVIDLRTGDSGAIFSFLTGASVRAGCRGTRKQFWHNLLFTRVIHNLRVALPPVHPGADQSLRVVSELGITTTDSMPRLYLTADSRARANTILAEAGLATGAKMVTINPCSRWKYKEWDNRKWGEVIDHIWETHNLPSVLIGSPEEAAICQEIAAGREGYTFSLAGKTSLGELAAILSMSTLHLGVDSAAPHIAAALGTPTVTIHGPTDWRGWRITDDMHKIATPQMECVPCNQRGCNNTGTSRCLEFLEAEAIISIADQLLGELESGSHRCNLKKQGTP